MIYSYWDIEQNILKLVNLGHFLPFYPPKKPQKSKFWKMKELAGDIIILHMCTKNHNHMQGSWDTEWDRHKIFVIFCHSVPCQPPDNPENQNFKIEKHTWRYYHFTHLHYKWNLHYKWQSYDVWFLRYGAWQTEFLSFWTVFCSFTPPLRTQKIKILKKWKNHLKILSFYKCEP